MLHSPLTEGSTAPQHPSTEEAHPRTDQAAEQDTDLHDTGLHDTRHTDTQRTHGGHSP